MNTICVKNMMNPMSKKTTVFFVKTSTLFMIRTVVPNVTIAMLYFFFIIKKVSQLSSERFFQVHQTGKGCCLSPLIYESPRQRKQTYHILKNHIITMNTTCAIQVINLAQKTDQSNNC